MRLKILLELLFFRAGFCISERRDSISRIFNERIILQTDLLQICWDLQICGFQPPRPLAVVGNFEGCNLNTNGKYMKGSIFIGEDYCIIMLKRGRKFCLWRRAFDIQTELNWLFLNRLKQRWQLSRVVMFFHPHPCAAMITWFWNAVSDDFRIKK